MMLLFLDLKDLANLLLHALDPPTPQADLLLQVFNPLTHFLDLLTLLADLQLDAGDDLGWLGRRANSSKMPRRCCPITAKFVCWAATRWVGSGGVGGFVDSVD